mmetsp:Transcript_68859/g.121628  ORF Transcript_68859/g.121628 Transcript_68859/m.121628 type:complete len:123 (+) Transcript_68859:4243-4611(+)
MRLFPLDLKARSPFRRLVGCCAHVTILVHNRTRICAESLCTRTHTYMHTHAYVPNFQWQSKYAYMWIQSRAYRASLMCSMVAQYLVYTCTTTNHLPTYPGHGPKQSHAQDDDGEKEVSLTCF